MLLYLTVMLKPFAPVIMDRFAHAFAEAEHIATVHAIYGEHHLQNKLADMATENESNKSHHTLIESCNTPFHIATGIYAIIFIPTRFFTTYFLFQDLSVAIVSIPLDERPPRTNC